MAGANTPLLALRDVSVRFRTARSDIQVTRGVSFEVLPGERVGLVGESGCGKSVTGLAILRLLPPDISHIDGRIEFEGTDLASLPEPRMRKVRGRGISMIFQEPMSALDPVFTVGDQIAEAWIAHFPERADEGRERALQALAQVGIPLPARRYSEYPHQLSGGMRQRVMIAMAIVCEPRLIIADEPTTALDVTVQAQIMALLSSLGDRLGTAMLFITHDLGVVAESCSRMLTMYAGEVVEDCGVDSALLRPRHPYTSGLLQSLPGHAEPHSRLVSIPGRVPSPREMPAGCRFRPRCAFAEAPCEAEQALLLVTDETMPRISPMPLVPRQVRCVRAPSLELPGTVAA